VFVIRLCEFEEEDARCEVIDIGETVSDDSSGEFMGYYLGSVKVKYFKGTMWKRIAYLEVERGETLLHCDVWWLV
jgi:hypothetical protein